MGETRNKLLVFIPTYNEKENAGKLCREILALGLPLDLLFIDDNSPDGTGEILDGLAKRERRVTVLHRRGKMGIGSAHQAGISWAYANGYQQLITMDCDFTHLPEYIPMVLAKAGDHDIVVGSRHLQEKSLEGWNILRKFLTVMSHFMTATLLRMPYDATGAFRLYRLDKIPQAVFGLVSSAGYSFFFESLFILHENKFSIQEMSIRLPARTSGHSKMRYSDAWHSFKLLLDIYVKSVVNKKQFRLDRPAAPKPALSASQEWDTYWAREKTAGNLLYDAIAVFYRKYIIKRNLNNFIKKHFNKDAELLHAGCGGGQVDEDLHDQVRIIGLDISAQALKLYRTNNRGGYRLIQGSILDIPLPDSSVDGVYNLGVMEHFNREDIGRILGEFHRVLKPGGKILLFWPPEFGLSVIFLKIVRSLLSLVKRADVKIHPDEISRLQSRKELVSILSGARFKLIDYSFGPGDLFTYVILAAEKE